MKGENVILEKTYKFGLRILKLVIHLRKKKVDAVLCSQLLSSGTSKVQMLKKQWVGHPEKILSIKFRLLIVKQEKQDIGYGFYGTAK